MVSLDYIDESFDTSQAYVSGNEASSDPVDNEHCYLKVHASSFSTNQLATEKAFFEMVASPEILHVVLDLTNSIHFNSRALKLLVELQLGLEGKGGSLTLIGVTVVTERLFAYTRLDRFFNYKLAGVPSFEVAKKFSN